MIFGFGKELSVFLHAILAGNLVCLVYYFLRILRRIIKHNLLAISLEDIIFWVWTGIHLFIQISRLHPVTRNDGTDQYSARMVAEVAPAEIVEPV